MRQLIVLFRLRPGADRSVYETWAKETDLPIVRGLSSVDGFRVHRVEGLFGTDAEPPYEYVEIIDISDMTRFGEEVGSDQMQQVAAEFREFADDPQFMLTTTID